MNDYELGFLKGWLLAKDAPKEILAIIDSVAPPGEPQEEVKKTSSKRGRKPIIPDDKESVVRELVAARKTEYEIAKELGCKPHHVTSFRRRHGITYVKSQSFDYQENGIDIKRFPAEYAEGAGRPKSVRAQSATPINTRLEIVDE